MTEPITFNEQALFDEIVQKGLAEGVTDREAWSQLVENVIDGHSMWAEMHDDQDLEGIQTTMQARWPEFEAELNKREA